MARDDLYPVYLIAGFLDGGKTTFINGILADGFAIEDKTLLLCCEEGEVEYDKKLLRNVTVATVDEQKTLTPEFLLAQQRRAQATQVIVEYNGMWKLEDFYTTAMPEKWVLYQIVVTAHGPTFELYAKNMGSLMLEKLRNADMIIINRCDDALCAALRKRNLRLINRQADIFLEHEDGAGENYMDGTVSAFDVSQGTIHISDEDYGVWFVEVMDAPQMYEGKRVIFKAMMCRPPEYGAYFTPGRFAMVCCEEDMSFLALGCRGYDPSGVPEGAWVEVTATVHVEEWEPYQGEGPILHVEGLRPCKRPKQEIVQM